MPLDQIELFDAARIPDPSREESFHADATYVFTHLANEVVPAMNERIAALNAALDVDTVTLLESLAVLQATVAAVMESQALRVATVAEGVIVDDAEYATGSQSLAVFREFLIPETVADSRLIVSFDCQMLPSGGDNGDAGQLNDIFCADAAGDAQVVGGQILDVAAYILKTSNSTSNTNAAYAGFSRTLPELPSSAKIDLNPFGIDATGWRLIARQREYYNSTARTRQSRLNYKEIANVN